MKKKIVALCLVLALALTAIGGATLAYFTDFETETNEFVVGNVDIELNENGFEDGAVLLPGSKTVNAVEKSVTVKNVGANDAYLWIEVWVPSALDDGDDNSPAAPGKGNSLHFNYNSSAVVETKATYLGSKYMKKDADGNMVDCGENDEGAAAYNGYVHYAKDGMATVAKTGETIALLDQVYMDSKVAQCTEGHKDCMVLIDAKPAEGKPATHYTGEWNVIVNAVGFQADGFTMATAIAEYYGKPLEIW